MTKKVRNLIIIAAVVVVLIPVYFFVVKPLIAPEEEEKEPVPELLEGEVLGVNNRILMFEHVEKASMYSIEVHNGQNTFKFVRGKDGNFQIEGMETVSYNLEQFSALVVSAGYTISMRRLDFDEMDEDFSVYGLGDNDNPAWYVVTKLDGTAHKVYIGNKIATGAGYYCRYEGRKAIYILDTTLAGTLLADIHDLITPVLAWPVSSAQFTAVDDFIIMKNGKPFVAIDMLTAKENGTDMPSYELKYPVGFRVNLTTYSRFLEIFAQFVGDKCVAAGPDELKDLSPEWLKSEFGIDVENPYYYLTYKVDGVTTDILFSEPDEYGDMYAYTTLYMLVAKINVSTAPFVNWGLLEFVERAVFGENINDVKKIEIIGALDEKNTKGNKIDVNATFTLDGEGQEILIYENDSKDAYGADDLKNFRQLYKSFFKPVIEDYIEDESVKERGTLLLTFNVDMDNGDRYEYKFYQYSSRHVYYTVNGEGEFYVLINPVKKIIRDTDRMIIGDQIEPDNKD